ncbi:MAG: hypothetical protein KAY32_00785 [Candidatus Eisenbacteria sp.]|nr:hypothetical protein [Candidatus Eisenbacteria bacterium]
MASSTRLWYALRRLAAGDSRPRQLSVAVREKVVAEAIDQLPERARLLVALRYFEGLGRMELSAALGLAEAEIDREITAAVTEIHAALDRAEARCRVGSAE